MYKPAAMPGSTGGSYRSLVGGRNDDVVYRSTTTTVAGNSPGVLGTVKKAFSFASSSPTKGERLLVDVNKSPVVVSSRYCMVLCLFGLLWRWWEVRKPYALFFCELVKFYSGCYIRIDQ